MKEVLAAVILAGGEARRMGGRDKALCELWGKSLLQHVLERLQGVTGRIVISANGDGARFDEFSLPVVNDLPLPVKSPLLGILSALDYFEGQSSPPAFLLCVPADTPVFPSLALQELREAATTSMSGVAYLQVNGQVQPLFAIVSLAQRNALRRELERGRYGVQYVLNDLGAEIVSLEVDEEGAFANINSAKELQALELSANPVPRD